MFPMNSNEICFVFFLMKILQSVKNRPLLPDEQFDAVLIEQLLKDDFSDELSHSVFSAQSCTITLQPSGTYDPQAQIKRALDEIDAV